MPLERPRLPPYPRGWYAVGFSDEFRKGSVETRRLAGRELLVFRTESGAVAAMDPICPHLGAHMGHGGTVEGETIRCPFHGFRFGVDGACVATGYNSKPPRVTASTWPIIERHGVVLVYSDITGQPPAFDVPELDMTGFTGLTTRSFKLRGHPQDTTENSVDLGHLAIVHGYDKVRTLEDLHTDGAFLGARYSFFRPVGLLGEGLGGITAEFEVRVHGLGYSYVEVILPAIGVITRNFVFSTPVGDMDLELRIAMAMYRMAENPKLHPALRFASRLPIVRGPLQSFLLKKAFGAFENDVQQDFVIWNHKEFVPRPALAQGDGPVMRYRRWAEQFYKEPPPGPTHHLPVVFPAG